MKLFEKVIIILAVVAGCAGIILVLTFTLAPGVGKEERALSPYRAPGEKEALLERIDHIETEVNKMKVPASYGDQFYVLRGHIGFVRQIPHELTVTINDESNCLVGSQIRNKQ